ncbi:metallophosphoesterase [Thermoproteota archaeon]
MFKRIALITNIAGQPCSETHGEISTSDANPAGSIHHSITFPFLSTKSTPNTQCELPCKHDSEPFLDSQPLISKANPHFKLMGSHEAEELVTEILANAVAVFQADPHAHLGPLSNNFIKAGLATPSQDSVHPQWVGKNKGFVVLGDLVDYGNNPFGVLEYLENLHNEARSNGGQGILLAGNHDLEIMLGHFNFSPIRDFDKPVRKLLRSRLLHHASMGTIQAAALVNGKLCTHAGLHPALLSTPEYSGQSLEDVVKSINNKFIALAKKLIELDELKDKLDEINHKLDVRASEIHDNEIDFLGATNYQLKQKNKITKSHYKASAILGKLIHLFQSNLAKDKKSAEILEKAGFINSQTLSSQNLLTDEANYEFLKETGIFEAVLNMKESEGTRRVFKRKKSNTPYSVLKHLGIYDNLMELAKNEAFLANFDVLIQSLSSSSQTSNTSKQSIEKDKLSLIEEYKTILTCINTLLKDPMFNVDSKRGGSHAFGGVFWNDGRSLQELDECDYDPDVWKLWSSIIQICGHSRTFTLVDTVAYDYCKEVDKAFESGILTPLECYYYLAQPLFDGRSAFLDTDQVNDDKKGIASFSVLTHDNHLWGISCIKGRYYPKLLF